MARLRRCKVFLAVFCLIELTSARSCDDKSKRNTDDDFDAVLSRMKRDEVFRKRFDPLPVSIHLENSEPSSYKALHGLSNMQKVSQHSYKLDQGTTGTVLNFQYPKLCVKCNVTDPKDQGPGQPISIEEECFHRICAKNTQGRLEIIGDQHPLAIKDFSVDKLQFEIEADENQRTPQLKSSQAEERVKGLLPSLEKKMNALLNRGHVAAELSMYLYMAKRREDDEACKNVTATTRSPTIVIAKPARLFEQQMDPRYIEESIDRIFKSYRDRSDSMYGIDPLNLAHRGPEIISFVTKGSRQFPERMMHPCFIELHGLSHIRKDIVNTHTIVDTRHTLQINVHFQFPKLCLKCDLERLPKQTLSQVDRSSMTAIGNFINVCAKHVTGLMKINAPGYITTITPHNIHRLKVDFEILKLPKFELDFAGNYNRVPKKVIPIWNQLKEYLPSLERPMHSELNNRNLHSDIWKAMVDSFMQTGKCLPDNCTHLEGKADFEFMGDFSENLHAPRKAHRVNVTVECLNIYQVLIDTLTGLEDINIVFYQKIKVSGRRRYYMLVSLENPKICLHSRVGKIPFRNLTQFSMCAENVSSLLVLYVMKSKWDLIVPEEIKTTDLKFNFRLINVGVSGRDAVMDPSFQRELEEEVKKRKIFSRLYEDFISSKIRTFARKFENCQYGNCLESDY